LPGAIHLMPAVMTPYLDTLVVMSLFSFIVNITRIALRLKTDLTRQAGGGGMALVLCRRQEPPHARQLSPWSERIEDEV
jgi:hypothetical protein